MDYVDLDVWKKSRSLVNEIYNLTKKFPKEELFGLVSQMRRSAISVVSNIAEGIGRKFSKETIHFLYISRDSLYELETQLYISYDQVFCSKEDLDFLLEKISDCKRLINGFIKYYGME